MSILNNIIVVSFLLGVSFTIEFIISLTAYFVSLYQSQPINRKERNTLHSIKNQLGLYIGKYVFIIPFYCTLLELKAYNHLRFKYFGIVPILVKCIVVNDNNEIILNHRKNTLYNFNTMEPTVTRLVRIGKNPYETFYKALTMDFKHFDLKNIKLHKKIMTPYTNVVDNIIYLFYYKIDNFNNYERSKYYDNHYIYNLENVISLCKKDTTLNVSKNNLACYLEINNLINFIKFINESNSIINEVSKLINNKVEANDQNTDQITDQITDQTTDQIMEKVTVEVNEVDMGEITQVDVSNVNDVSNVSNVSKLFINEVKCGEITQVDVNNSDGNELDTSDSDVNNSDVDVDVDVKIENCYIHEVEMDAL
jgi:hypothetical protein